MRFIKAVVVGLVASLLFPASASALPAEQAVGFQFTFNPSLAITLSSDELVVSNLLPGNYASSNTITINVQTNNHSGYTLTAAVGDSEVPTLANSNLVNTTASEATFTSLASNANLTLANFGSNYWGYTTTQSLSDSSLYSGLTYGTATTLNQTVDPSGKSVNGYYGGNTTDFTIGVNAGADQVSGEYTNVISFAIVPNISTDFIIESLKYLQDFTELADDEMTSVINSMAAGQSYQLIDARDGEIYNLAKLADGKVWLQDNLALDPTSSSVILNESNTNATAAQLSAFLDSETGVKNVSTGFNSYTDARINTDSKNTDVALALGQSGTGKVGVYYNYCAVTAGTYCMDSSSGSGDAQYDICPKGWRLPTGGASGEYHVLYSATTNAGRNYVDDLKLPLSGYFNGSDTYVQGTTGYFRSSTYASAADMYSMAASASGIYLYDVNDRRNGFSIRCLLDPATPYTVYYDKNTTDTVSDLPSTWNGTINTVRRPTLSTATPTRSNYNFIGWCDTLPTTSGDTDTCSGTTYTPGSELPASGNSSTVYAMWKVKTFTCTKQYRLENADGTWGDYVTDTDEEETVNYGGSCSYSKTVTDYKAGSASATNGAQGSTSTSNITADTTLSLDFYRNTYSLTVSAGSNTSSPTGSGTYRWGQSASVGVTKATNVTCTSYGTPTWTATAGTAPAAGTSTSFTMPTSNATITATSAASSVAQTITLSMSGGASGINIGGNDYTGSSVSLTCGTYNISGNYDSGYEFNSWSASGSASVASTSSASTTMTVSGPGALTLNGKESLPSLAMQNVTLATCPTTPTRVYDTRDNSIYTIQKLADNRCWLLDNLRLDLTNATVKNNLTADTTNASATTLNYLKNGGGTTSDQYATAGVANWTSSYSYSAPLIATSGTGNNGSWTKDTLQSYGSGSGKIGVYYNYCAASAGSYCYGDGTSGGSPSGNATEDICPKGWRMPTGGSSGEYQSLYTAYSRNATNFKNALRTPLPDRFINGSVSYQGSFGYFWSSTYNNSKKMYDLYVDSSYVDPQDDLYRYYGFSVRCILQY